MSFFSSSKTQGSTCLSVPLNHKHLWSQIIQNCTLTKPIFYKNSRAKSPSFAPNPSMYSEALNASLQSALGFAENNLPFLAHSGAAAAASMASFHHHQQQREREEKQGLER